MIGAVEVERTGGETVATPKRTPEEIVAALDAFPEELARVIADRSAEALLRPARDGGWGVVEILPHLRDWEEIFLDRVRAVVHEDRPRLASYDDQLWAIERDYRGQDPRKTLGQVRHLRGELVACLRDLPAASWERVGEHEVWGPITLHWMTDQVCDHDREHLDQIRDALA